MSNKKEWEKQWDKLHPNMVGLAVEKQEKAFISSLLAQAEREAKIELAKEILGNNSVVDMDILVEDAPIETACFWAEVKRVREIAKRVINSSTNYY